VESAIDALSAPELPELIVSTAGLTYVLPTWLTDIDAEQVVCGYGAAEPAQLPA